MEFTPLLFTPRTGDRLRGGPGAGGAGGPTESFRTPGGGMERSPTGGGAGGAFGAAAAAPRLGSTFREGTPRRRSMTPSGSAMEPSGMLYPPGGSLFESPTAGGPAFGQSTQAGWAVAAPPPPPTHSLADELPGGGGGFGGAQPAAGGRSRFGPLPVSSPAGGGAAPSTASNPDDPTGCWVTAFGFAPADRALVLGELARCGDVRRFGSGRSGGSGASASSSSVNWVHVQFGTPAQAARARSLDGCLLAGRLLVGVKPLDSAGAADVARLVAVGSGADGDGEGGAGDAGGELRAAPPAMPVRPYRVDAGDQRALPQHAQSAWSKISELVFGL